jgi:hypothetical protein
MSLIKAMWFKALYRRRRTEPVATQKPVEWSRLRIDRNDGSHVLEYRIADGWVEYRAIKSASENAVTEAPWERITPAGLQSLLTTKSIVALWLSHRLGIDALRRACGQPCGSASDQESAAGRLRRPQAITQ